MTNFQNKCIYNISIMSRWGKCTCTSINNFIFNDEKQTNWL